MFLKDLIYKAVGIISVMYPEGEAREMVFAYLDDVFGIRRHDHILDPARTLSEDKVQRTLEDFARMASGEPLQYVTGKAHFYGRQFRVTPDVLIPRQETELLCNETVSLLNVIETDNNVYGMVPAVFGAVGYKPEILDMCTGSGCIAWTLALEMPGSKVTAIDISDEALKVASSQDFSEEMSRTGALRPRFIKADVLEGPENNPELCPADDSQTRKFDIIVSNPPYVMDSEKTLMRTNVLDHEPHLALFVPDDDPLRFYKAIAGWARTLLKEGGYGMVEINEALAEETADIYRKAGFSQVCIEEDLNGKHRFVKFRDRGSGLQKVNLLKNSSN